METQGNASVDGAIAVVDRAAPDEWSVDIPAVFAAVTAYDKGDWESSASQWRAYTRRLQQSSALSSDISPTSIPISLSLRQT